MKIKTIVIFFGLVGIALGTSTAFYRYGGAPKAGLANGGLAGGDAALQDAAAGQPRAKVQVDNADYDFGSMPRGTTAEHEFVFSNQGDAPLKLTVGDTTCKCTVGEVAGGDVPPGGETRVKLEWSATSSAYEFRQSATIHTNDPARSRVTLTIHGNLVEPANITPSSIAFGEVRQGNSGVAEVFILSNDQQEFEVTGYKWQNASHEESLTVNVEPLPKLDLPTPSAKAGLAMRVTLDDAAAPGQIEGSLELTTSLEELPRISIPLSGKVVSEISISGPGFDAAKDVLRMGPVEATRGKELKLMVFIRGEAAQGTKLQVAQTEPEWLQAEIGDPLLQTERVTQLPLTIKIPPGSPESAYLGPKLGGFGRIVLKTDDPQVPTVEFKVLFTVGR